MHGTCVAIGGRGVLILGPPGSGKSDLALRLIDQPGRGIGRKMLGAELVSDDQVTVTRTGNRLLARAPASLLGKLEIRGIGIAPVKTRRTVELTLAIMLTEHRKIERMPEASESIDVLGIALRAVRIDSTLASAPARVRAALDFE
ncbi:MAG: serine/threonine protein kinase [Rhizobiales bacterium]|nr:serine/threonine protein kinase [Hyphomicrobiales bacterium]